MDGNLLPSNELYEAALRPKASPLRRAAYWTWMWGAWSALMAFAWAEPWSSKAFAALAADGAPAWLIECVGVPLVMALRAVLIVETFGYAYHRFFQHVGWFTRRSFVFRRNQRYHWIHHMIIYPIGRFYRRAMDYIPSEDGIAWSWVAPAVIVSAAFVGQHGLNAGTLVFLLSIAAYAKGVIDLTHERFHLVKHPWSDKPYFHRLEEIHLLHHWDQRTNFTIVHPAMDVLFGTYLDPAEHEDELRIALEDTELTVSDLINWRYLLLEATPSEYAAFISAAKQHPRSLRKVGLLFTVLRDRLAAHPGDAEAKELQARAADLLKALGRDVDELLDEARKPPVA